MAAVSTGRRPMREVEPAPFSGVRSLLRWWARPALRGASVEAGTRTTLRERREREALHAVVVLAVQAAERDMGPAAYRVLVAYYRGGRSEAALVDEQPETITAEAARRKVGRLLHRAERCVLTAGLEAGLVEREEAAVRA